MTVKIEKLERVFLFNGSKLPDVNPEFSIEQMRDVYVNTYPELATAVVEGPTPYERYYAVCVHPGGGSQRLSIG
jgi:PRTRC genetic system protein C